MFSFVVFFIIIKMLIVEIDEQIFIPDLMYPLSCTCMVHTCRYKVYSNSTNIQKKKLFEQYEITFNAMDFRNITAQTIFHSSLFERNVLSFSRRHTTIKLNQSINQCPYHFSTVVKWIKVHVHTRIHLHILTYLP